MTQVVNKELEKLKFRLNLILIAGLCSLTLAPCIIFFIRGEGKMQWMIMFVFLGYLVSLLPRPFYDKLQISKDASLYKKLLVHKFKKFATNGDYINKKIRKYYPSYRNVTSRENILEKINETYLIERSHTVLFVFCLLTNIYAVLTNSITTAIILFIGNILFNYYPNLLQQYNRVRYKKAIEKTT